MSEEYTYPKILLRNYQKWGDTRVSMRKKKLGIWNEYTWKDCYEQVKWLCMGLISIGLERGDKVCILGDNDPQWFWGMLATQSAGGVAFGIYPDCLPSEIKYYMEHADTKFLIVRDQEQVDKLLQIRDGLPLLRKVIYWDFKGMKNYKDPILMSFAELLKIGKKYEESHLGLFEKMVTEGKSEDIANLFYTSGTTGLPKGAMFSHRALISMYNYAFRKAFITEDCKNLLSFLPPAGIVELVQSLGANLFDGIIVNFPEELDTAGADLREISPNSVTFWPRQWRNIYFQTMAKFNDSSLLAKFAWKTACRIGYRMVDIRSAGKIPNVLLRICYKFVERLIFKRVKDNIGVAKVKIAFITGAVGSPDIVKFFNAIGVSLRALYAGTEFGIVAAHQKDDIRFETVGRVFPEVEIKISDKGDIWVRSNTLFSGYYKDPRSNEMMMKDGWFQTGDAGSIGDDRHLFFYDRLSELSQFTTEVRYSPQLIESRLSFSPYISNCLILGGKERNYPSAIICLDFRSVGKWAREYQIPYTTLTDLSQKNEVADLILRDVNRVKGILPEASHLKRFVLLHKEFDPDEAELTRTMKLRRSFIEERYSNIIHAIDRGDEEVPVETNVTYRDGRTTSFKTTIKIRRCL